MATLHFNKYIPINIHRASSALVHGGNRPFTHKPTTRAPPADRYPLVTWRGVALVSLLILITVRIIGCNKPRSGHKLTPRVWVTARRCLQHWLPFNIPLFLIIITAKFESNYSLLFAPALSVQPQHRRRSGLKSHHLNNCECLLKAERKGRNGQSVIGQI